MSEPILSVRGLTVTFHRDSRDTLVLDDISFDAMAGEIIAVVGESGAGKSTLGRALQGLLPRESRPLLAGSIRLTGTELVGASPAVLRATRRSLVRAVPQDPMAALDPTMRIGRQLTEAANAHAPIFGWLERTGLTDPQRIAESYPHNLSGGQRQRVLIAKAMLANPQLLIADEPTTALDVTTQAEILNLLRDLAREQRTAILFITHDLAVAGSLADRIIVLYGGRIVETGHIGDVLRDPAHPYTAGLLSARFDLSSDRRRPLPTLPPARRLAGPVDHTCGYASRCPLAQDDCTMARPPLDQGFADSRAVACFHSDRTRALITGKMLEPWPARRAGQPATALELHNVSKSFATADRTRWGRRRARRVLGSIDLTIRRGECVALVGESGAGKSTILRIAAGLLAPDGGDVSRTDARPQIVYQDAGVALTPWLTIGEQIGERLRPLRLGTRELRLRVADALELVGLNPVLEHALPRELSGGEAQRAAIARAVIVPPGLLLCDEPTSALDVSLTAATLNLLGDLRRRLDVAVLFVTHDLAAARMIADRIAVLRDGKLIEDGDPDILIAEPKTAYTRSLIAAVPHLLAGGGQ